MNNSVTIDGMAGQISPNGMIQFDRSRTNVQFYRKSVPDPVRTRQQGRPFYVTRDYVRIQHPGERDFVDKPVDDDERVKYLFPVQWSNFQRGKEGQEQMPEGTPVDILFAENPAIAANLHTQGVHTAEQLAELSAHALSEIGMGSTEWSNRAKKFLASSAGGAEYHRMQKQIADLNSQNEVLQNNLKTLSVQMERLLAAQQGVPPSMIPRNTAQAFQTTFQTTPAVEDTQTYMGPFGDPLDAPKSNAPRPVITSGKK